MEATMTLSLADFLGRWRVDRDIAHGDGSRGRFIGTAEWVPGEAGADYVERGVLQVGAGSFQAERTYRWGPGLDVYFEDGRFFHAVPPEGGDAAHWCDPDQYDVAYDFTCWPEWTARWQVRGPRKDYVMTSRYAPFTG
ncbi:hypothetical protein SSE37_25183 [Sagittula stellata E-37]|uniref:DUF6314 domain-containing protein n=2 Tax=Sagittula stellata TaxID=52603 RepID=A3KA20_SAGS3|nr:hypothetical protein SSE37_25183 [Sagittula stellata E-37]